MMHSTPPLGLIWAPKLARTEPGRLIPDRQHRVKRPAPGDLLDRYCRIAESPDTDAAARRFARSWGVAGLCDCHSLPIGHSERCKGDPADSVQAHKDFARCLESLRNIGLALGRRRAGEDL